MKKQVVDNSIEELITLRTLIRDRIEDLNDVKGGAQGKHAFKHYLWHIEEAMFKLEKKEYPEAINVLRDLDSLFSERITELYKVKGAQTIRQNYMFYLWKLSAAYTPLRLASLKSKKDNE
jgi:hypothetical protein